MVGPDIRRKFTAKKIYRGSQVIFGERKHLGDVLASVAGAKLLRTRKLAESKALKKMIEARTRELNAINPSWDHKFVKACNPKTSARELLRLAISAKSDDYLLARVVAEHAQAPGELLTRLATHPYWAVRENVARHPRTPAEVLRKLAEDAQEPLWFLVACNPSCPRDLRERLRARMRHSASL